jgi:tetratricopeptide (TPR) repeat protein
MRFFITLRGNGLLLIIIFFIGMTRSGPKPEDFTSPSTAKEFLRRGELYAERGEYEKALADHNQAEQLRPRDYLGIYHSIYFHQANALVALNRPAEAIEKFQKVKRVEQEDGLSTGHIDRRIAELQNQIQNSSKP